MFDPKRNMRNILEVKLTEHELQVTIASLKEQVEETEKVAKVVVLPPAEQAMLKERRQVLARLEEALEDSNITYVLPRSVR